MTSLRGMMLAGVLAALAGAAFYYSGSNSAHGRTEAAAEHAAPPPPALERFGDSGLLVPPEIAQNMVLRTGVVQAAAQPIDLPSFQGVLAIDNDCLSRVHTRFSGEVVELGRRPGTEAAWRVGDRVHRGDLLAVVWSTDLGKKKSELVDALAKLKVEQDQRDRLKKLADDGVAAGRTYREAERDVQARLVEIANAERTLRTWRLTDADLAEIRSEAVRLGQGQGTAELNDWARVEIRAPIDGTILEKNTAVGDIVDTAEDLFKLGDLSHLAVWAHVYEEDLPLLESLPRPTPWTVTLPSRPHVAFAGTLDKVGDVIDPSQHTALVTGRVENLQGELKVGQFITVALQVPPAADELALPAGAVVEDGHDSLVFLQPDPAELRFVRRPVTVVRRLRDVLFVKSEPGVSGGLAPGARVVTAGAMLLNSAMEQLPPPSAEAPAYARVPSQP